MLLCHFFGKIVKIPCNKKNWFIQGHLIMNLSKCLPTLVIIGMTKMHGTLLKGKTLGRNLTYQDRQYFFKN
jgi:hypothetical protein